MEGEYLNGKKNGKGKFYDDNGIVKYEYEYINGNLFTKDEKLSDNLNINDQYILSDI